MASRNGTIDVKREEASGFSHMERGASNISQAEGKAEVTPGGTHGIDTSAIPPGSNIVYEKKVAIMNQALIDIGMGSFQWKIYAMTGFGWFVDNVSHGEYPASERQTK